MRTIVSHTVMFLLDDGEGDVVPTETGYGRVSGVTVHLNEGRDATVTVGVRRCRKDGSDDQRMGNVYTSAEIDTAPWVERAREAVGTERAEAACRKALEAMAPCVVGWAEGSTPAWAERLAAVVPDLQAVLGIEPVTR